MDNFLKIEKTWKTKSYNNQNIKTRKLSRSTLTSKFNNKSINIDNHYKARSPLKLKQISDVLKNNSYDQSLVDLFFNVGNNEQLDNNSNVIGVTISTSSTTEDKTKNCNYDKCTKKSTSNISGTLRDYVDCPSEKENDTTLILPLSGNCSDDSLIDNISVTANAINAVTSKKDVTHNHITSLKPNPDIHFDLSEKMVNGVTPEHGVHLKGKAAVLSNIYADLNSPSASVRLRAIKALKGENLTAYCQFDIPHERESFSFYPDESISLQDVMRNIVVYVEIRSGEDNRSAGVRKVIESLGAQVNLTLLRDTTHVIFKDGLLSTYKKAKQWGIPVVSILWIEACKTQYRICDPKDYPISNIDRYENPELYEKMKRVKSMQPDSECNKRIRPKALNSTPKNTNTSSATSTPSSLKVCNSKANSLKNKTDIRQYFQNVEGISKITPMTKNFESPATQLLNRIHTECCTMQKSKTSLIMNKPNFVKELKFSQEKEQNSSLAMRYADNIKKEVQNSLEIGNDWRLEKSDVSMTLKTESNYLNDDMSISNTLVKKITIERQSNHKIRIENELLDSKALVNFSEKEKNENNIASTSDTSIPKEECKKFKEIMVNKEGYTNSNEKISGKVTRKKTLNKIDKQNDGKSSEGKENSFDMNRSDEIQLSKIIIDGELAMDDSECKNIDVTLEELKEIDQSGNKTITNDINETVCSLKAMSIGYPLVNNGSTIKTIEDKLSSTKLSSSSATSKKSPSTFKNNSKLIRRRRTLYTPKEMEEAKIATLTPIRKTIQDGICTISPNCEKKKKSAKTVITLDSKEMNLSKEEISKPQNSFSDTNDLLLEEINNPNTTPITFSSIRTPGCRRTLFDLSMGIISQNLQCINQSTSARRSLLHDNENIEQKQYKEYKHNHETKVMSSQSSLTYRKKRKLYVTDDLTPPSQSNSCQISQNSKSSQEIKTNLKTDSTTSTSKRRRTLMPILPQRQITNVSETKVSRRSTLDFEQINKLDVRKQTKTATLTNTIDKKITTKRMLINCADTKPVMVCTNMPRTQKEIINEAIKSLGCFRLNERVTDETTHLVSYEKRRTMNLLRALLRGLWIVNFNWIVESLKAGYWLSEEAFEMNSFSRAVEICRAERQAFGKFYKCELFKQMGFFYISSHCNPISIKNVHELILSGGGKVTNIRQRANYVIGSPKPKPNEKLVLSPLWILDSITEMQLMKFDRYEMAPSVKL